MSEYMKFLKDEDSIVCSTKIPYPSQLHYLFSLHPAVIIQVDYQTTNPTPKTPSTTKKRKTCRAVSETHQKSHLSQSTNRRFGYNLICTAVIDKDFVVDFCTVMWTCQFLNIVVGNGRGTLWFGWVVARLYLVWSDFCCLHVAWKRCGWDEFFVMYTVGQCAHVTRQVDISLCVEEEGMECVYGVFMRTWMPSAYFLYCLTIWMTKSSWHLITLMTNEQWDGFDQSIESMSRHDAF